MKKVMLKKRSSAPSVSLPLTKSPVNPADAYTLFLFGPEGVGKTTFCSQAQDPIFIATEAGLKFVEAYEVPSATWEDFTGAVGLLEESWRTDPKKFLYGAIVVDTADNAFEQCQMAVCERLGIEHPSDEEWGKGYQAVRMEFTKQLTRLALIDRQLILTSHEKTIEVKGRVLKTNKVVPTLSNTARRVILPMVDIIGHCGYRMGADGEATEERVVDFQPSELIEAKDRTGLLPKCIPLRFSEFRSYLTGEKKKPVVGPKPIPKIKRLGR